MSKHLINKCFLLKIPTLLFGITLHAQITAQDSAQIKHAVRAAQYCQEGLYEKAEQSIALALASDDEKDALYTWYVNGFIHKEIYKVRESNKLHSKHRDLAVEAFLKSKDLAGNHSDVYNNNSALKYLANTYYNDAISLAGSFEIENELEPDTLLYTYEWLCKQMSTEGVNKSLFYKQKGLRYQELWQNNVCDLSLNEKSFACYQTSLDYDKNDCDSFYNAGVLRYSIIQQYRNGALGSCNIELNEQMMLHETLALLLTGEQQCPNHIGIYNALYNTYMVIGETEKASHYQKHLNH